MLQISDRAAGRRHTPWLTRMRSILLATVVLLSGLPLSERASADDPAGTRSLRFLRANRLFLLSRLEESSRLDTPDADLVAWLNERMLVATRQLGDAGQPLPIGALSRAASPAELGELSAAIDSLRDRILDIEGRLITVRGDFLEHQRTELLVAIAAPANVATEIDSLALSWNGYEIVRTGIEPDERGALEAGGYRALHRSSARPLPQRLELMVDRKDGRIVHGSASVTPAENRLTIIVLETGTHEITSRVWSL